MGAELHLRPATTYAHRGCLTSFNPDPHTTTTTTSMASDRAGPSPVPQPAAPEPPETSYRQNHVRRSLVRPGGCVKRIPPRGLCVVGVGRGDGAGQGGWLAGWEAARAGEEAGEAVGRGSAGAVEEGYRCPAVPAGWASEVAAGQAARRRGLPTSDRMRSGRLAWMAATASASITTRVRPSRACILARPRMVWRSKPKTWSMRALTRSTEVRRAYSLDQLGESRGIGVKMRQSVDSGTRTTRPNAVA